MTKLLYNEKAVDGSAEATLLPGRKNGNQQIRAGGAEHVYAPRRPSSGAQAQKEMGAQAGLEYHRDDDRLFGDCV